MIISAADLCRRFYVLKKLVCTIQQKNSLMLYIIAIDNHICFGYYILYTREKYNPC